MFQPQIWLCIMTISTVNLSHLEHLQAAGADQDTIDFVQNCHDELLQFLDSPDEGFQLSRLLNSPQPDGECLIFYMLLFTY